MPLLLDDLLRLFPGLHRVRGTGYVVGGAVRDLLRGEKPADVDVACPDPEACAQALGGRVIRLGRDHLSAFRVTGGQHVYDFAELLDGNIDRDLARRDFTVNAMAVDLRSGHLLDPHGGARDLERRLVRMVGERNFDDDPLRMLKGVRMAVSLRFEFDDATLDAIRPRAARILDVSPERVSYELSVTFASGAFRKAVRLLRETALDVPLFGQELDVSCFHDDGVTPSAAFALLVGSPRPFAARFRWSDAFLRHVTTLQRLLLHTSEADLRLALYDAGEKVATQFPAMLRALGRDDRLPMPDFTTKPLLSGLDIARLTGLVPGPQLGALKRALLEAEIRGEVKTPGEAEAFVKRSVGPA